MSKDKSKHTSQTLRLRIEYERESVRDGERESERRWDRENRKRKENWNIVTDLTFVVTNLRVTVKLTVQNRQAKVFMVPSGTALVITMLKEPECDRKKTKNIKQNGNISLDDVIEIAKVMKPRSMAKGFFFFFG